MKYKTTIEIITDANNPQDAADIAGEYLRGALETGVDMRCHTRKLIVERAILVAISSFLFLSSLIIGSLIIMPNKTSSVIARYNSINNKTDVAVQPPLRTNDKTNIGNEFKKVWNVKQNEVTIKQIPPAK